MNTVSLQAKHIAIWLLLLAPAFLFAQTQTVRGRVIDRQSETPLIGATVLVIGAEPAIGATTDVDGRFALTAVPVGRQALQVTYLGYEPQTVPNLLITAGREVVLNLALEESLSAVEEVTIVARTNKDQPVNDMATISTRPFNTEEVLRYSGGRNDIAKLVANFAGVAANNDARNDIIIRGNSPTGVLWRMEGIPIPNPNHFSTLGTTGGPVSALNPNLVATSDFLTGAFPAEYGNALAGVFDVNLRTGNSEQFEFMGQLGAFSGLEALAEGPLNKQNNGSFVVAYRHSFVELADAAGLNFGTSALPKYKDLSFNVDFGNGKAGKFSVFGIGATSSIDFLGAEIDTTDLFADPNSNSYNTSKFGVIGLKHNFLLNDRSYIRTVVSASGTEGTYEEESLMIEDPLGGPLQTDNVKDVLGAYRVSSFYHLKLNARTSLRTGWLLQNQHLDTYVKTRQKQPDLNGDGVADWIEQRDYEGAFNTFEPYAQVQHRLNNTLTLNAGLHGLYFGYTNDFALEPRAAVNWQMAPRHGLSLGYGMHHQTQPLPVFFFRERDDDGNVLATNDDLGFTRNQHLVLAYQYKPSADWRLKAEAYMQWLSNVPVDNYPSSFSILNAGADFVFPDRGSLVNEGVGTNRGLELTAEKNFSRGYYGLVTLSLFEARYEGSDGIERSTAFDGGYVFNFLAGKEFQLGNTVRRFLTLDTKFTTAGGRPYTPVDLEASQQAGYEVLKEDEAFSLRLDDYLRWDVKVGFRLNSAKRKLSQTFFLDFQNVTNNENVFAQRYNEVRNEVGTLNQIGFFPDVLYRIEF